MSALTDAMRKKFGSPKEAIKAMGLDETLLALDSADDAFDAAWNEGAHPRGEGGKFAMSASHPTGAGPKFKSQAASHEEVQKHMGSLRQKFPEHHVTVHNQGTGQVHTFRPGEAYNPHIVGDSKEGMNMSMPTQFASTAALLVGTAIRPLLKPKAKVDLMPVFKDLTADGFDAKEFRGALDEALKGKIVKGADIKLAYDNFMPHVEGMAKGSDESVSEEQHNAMEAAAHGNSTLGIPQSVGKEFAEADKGKKFGDGYDNLFMKKAMDWMKSKGMDAGMTEEFMEHMGNPKGDRRADDAEEEEPEEVTEGFKNVEQHAEDRPRGRDMRRADDRRADDRRADDRRADDKRADDRRADDGDAHHAMDAATIEKNITEKLKAKFAAAERAREYIGQVDPMAFDTGEAIDRHVLKVKGYKRWNTVHVDAIPDVMGTIPKIGMRPVERMAQDSKFGIDETRRADAVKLAPGLANIRIGV